MLGESLSGPIAGSLCAAPPPVAAMTAPLLGRYSTAVLRTALSAALAQVSHATLRARLQAWQALQTVAGKTHQHKLFAGCCAAHYARCFRTYDCLNFSIPANLRHSK